VHRLAAACKKYKGITFTDSTGKIIDDNSPEIETEPDTTTGVGSTTYPVSSTGVGNVTQLTQHNDSTGVRMNNTADSTGMYMNNATLNENTLNENGNTNNTETGVTQEETPDPELPDMAPQEIHTQETVEQIDNMYDDMYVTPTGQELEVLEEMNATNMTELMTEQVDTDMQAAETQEGHTEADSSASHGYNLRPRPTKRNEKINLLQTTRQSTCRAVGEKPHLHVLMTQMSVKAGIKKVGDKGNDTVSKELRQLHDRRAMVPVRKDELSTEDKKRALRYLMFIKEKRDGAIKARGCADGRPQRQYTEKSDASSPTVSLEAMMISCCIDAKEG